MQRYLAPSPGRDIAAFIFHYTDFCNMHFIEKKSPISGRYGTKVDIWEEKACQVSRLAVFFAPHGFIQNPVVGPPFPHGSRARKEGNPTTKTHYYV